MASQCKTCRAPIVWMMTKQGTKMPVDCSSVRDGGKLFDVEKGHVSHFATCPNSRHHRRER